jgi:hypothetical protein
MSKTKSERISPKLRTALDLMVFGDETGKPLDYADAGRKLNISARSMRLSLDRPAVRQYLMQQRQVLRAALSAKTLHHLGEISAQRSNMNAAVRACAVLEQLDAEGMSRPMANTAPGVVIRIVARDAEIGVAPLIPAPGPSAPVIDVTAFGDDVIPPSFPGPAPTIGGPPPAPLRNDPLRLLPDAPLRRRFTP